MEPRVSLDDVLRLIPDSQFVDAELVNDLVEEAIDLVNAYTRRDFRATGELPGQVKRVVARMVARSIESDQAATVAPPGATNMSLTAGPFSTSWGMGEESTTSGVWLSKQDRLRLRGYKSGAFTVHIA